MMVEHVSLIEIRDPLLFALAKHTANSIRYSERKKWSLALRALASVCSDFANTHREYTTPIESDSLVKKQTAYGAIRLKHGICDTICCDVDNRCDSYHRSEYICGIGLRDIIFYKWNYTCVNVTVFCKGYSVTFCGWQPAVASVEKLLIQIRALKNATFGTIILKNDGQNNAIFFKMNGDVFESLNCAQRELTSHSISELIKIRDDARSMFI